MEKKNLDWANIGFTYMTTDKRYVADYKDGAWQEGRMTEDANVVISECAGILQYCQECFEGLKAYTTEDGSIVTFRPDLNAQRMMDSAARLEMPPFPKERFLEAVDAVVRENAAWVPPFGSGATLYLRPYMFASGPVMTLKEAAEKWGVTPRRVNYYCAAGRIPGAVKMAGVWLIPKNAEKPIDGRTKQGKGLHHE